MKRNIAFLFAVILLAGLGLTSCHTNKKEIEEAGFDLSALRKGTWTVDHVDVNSFDTQGNLIGTENYPFGEGTDNGICTFVYGENDIWTMNDNGELFTARYSVDDRVIYTDGGGTWGVRQVNASQLEMVLRSDQSLNPCDYTVTGAVYYLNRNNQ